MIRSAYLLAPLAALACASCVTDSDQPAEEIAGLSSENACFFVSQVNGYGRAPDDDALGDRIYVNTGARGRFLLETYGPCPDLDWSLQIGIDPRYQSNLCTGDTAHIVVPRPSGGQPDRCPVRVLGRMLED